MSSRARGITIVGAGAVGAAIAYFLFDQSIGDCIYLYDSLAGRARGKALDMIESQPIRRERAGVQGSDSLSSLTASQIVVLALTTDLFADATDGATERAILAEAERISVQLRDYTGIVLVASQHEELVMNCLQRHATIAEQRLLGLGTVPHTMHAHNVLAVHTGIDPSQIQLLIVSNGVRPVVVADATSIAGIPLDRLYPQSAAAEITQLLTTQVDAFAASAQGNDYRLAAAAARIVAAVDADMRRVLTISTISAMNHYHTDYAAAVPTVVSATGAMITLATETPALSHQIATALASPTGAQS